MEAETEAPTAASRPPAERPTLSQSPSITALAPALAAAQGKIRAASKDAVNPFFSTGERKARYADLAAVWEVIREPLSANGLSLLQLPETTRSGLWLETRLLHSSGEFLAFRGWWPVAKAPPRRERGEGPPSNAKWARTPQTYGSAITYARRYSLTALLGVAADEDDDGNAASGNEMNPTERARQAYEASRQQAPKTTAPMRAAAPPPGPPSGQEAAEISAKEAIEAAGSQEELQALVPRLQKLEGESRAAALEWFRARKAALGGA